MEERIVITGMGTVNPLGLNVADTWKNATEGVSGVGPLTLFDHQAQLVHIAAEVKNFDPTHVLDQRESRRRDRFELMAAVAASEAVSSSGLQITDENAPRIGVVISSAIGGLKALEDAVLTNHNEGPRRVSPFMIPMLMANGASGLIAIDHGIKGPCFSVASACASGADGIGMALLMLRSGMIDAALAGGSEAPITSTSVAAFDRVGAMSRQNDDYSMTPAPFDKNRDGLVMGEGAAVLVLERESSARKRGAAIHAELAGYASTADAFHVTAPHENGEGGTAAILQARCRRSPRARQSPGGHKCGRERACPEQRATVLRAACDTGDRTDCDRGAPRRWPTLRPAARPGPKPAAARPLPKVRASAG